MIAIYNVLLLIATPFILVRYLYNIIFRRKYTESLKGMLVFGLKEKITPIIGKRIGWIHAVSVGEVVAARAVVKTLKNDHPEFKILVSTVTETGQLMARKSLKQADAIIYYPIDFSPIVKRFLSLIHPEIYIIMETELWPNLYRECGRRGVPLVLANARISPRSIGRYRFLSSLISDTLSHDVVIAACRGEYKKSRLTGSGS